MNYTKENPLRVVTLCSGYDSQCLALERLKCNYPEFDYELIAWSEFDPDGIAPSLRSGQGIKGRGIGSCNSPKIIEIYDKEDNAESR